MPVPSADHELLAALCAEHALPAAQRFPLLQRLRVARGWASAGARQALLRGRLLAFYVAFQSSPNPADILALFATAPDFVQQVRWGRAAGGVDSQQQGARCRAFLRRGRGCSRTHWPRARTHN